MPTLIRLSLLLTLATGILAQAQMAPSTTELMCVHVMPLQMRFVQRHVNYTELTPELEKRTIEQYMKRLDEQKLFLLEGDYKKAEKMMQGIFAKLSEQDCSPLVKTQELYINSVEERYAFAKSYLGPKFKLNPKLTYKTDPKARTRPKTLAEAKTALGARLQYDVANYVGTGISIDSAKKHVLQTYERVLKHVRDTKLRDVYANYLDCFATSLDPHSNYMSADTLEDFQIQMRLSLDGIGATLSWQDGFTVVSALVPGGAAANSGLLKKKDKIVGVAQGDGQYVDVMEMELRDVIKLIRGPRGTPLRLKVLRKIAGKEKDKTENQTLEIPLVRDKIKLEEQAANINFIEREVNGEKLKIGLLNLPSFYHDERNGGPSASSDMKKLLAEAVKNKADAVVLDLTNNGGGSLPDAVDVSGLFLATGDIVRLGERAAQEGGPMVYETLADKDAAVDWNGPLVVLINRESASASEIVSGALQDYQRAVVVGGDHTFGKGTMQAVENMLPGLGAVKTTTGMFFTAGGQSTQHRGVSSDVTFPSPVGLDQYSEKALDYSLPPKKITPFVSPTAYVKDGPDSWIPVTPQIIDHLKTKATPRIEASTEFKKLVDERNKKKKDTSVTIASLLKGKDPAHGKVDSDEDKDGVQPSAEEKKKTYLARPDINEAANIAADLTLELRSVKARQPATQAAAK